MSSGGKTVIFLCNDNAALKYKYHFPLLEQYTQSGVRNRFASTSSRKNRILAVQAFLLP